MKKLMLVIQIVILSIAFTACGENGEQETVEEDQVQLTSFNTLQVWKTCGEKRDVVWKCDKEEDKARFPFICSVEEESEAFREDYSNESLPNFPYLHLLLGISEITNSGLSFESLDSTVERRKACTRARALWGSGYDECMDIQPKSYASQLELDNLTAQCAVVEPVEQDPVMDMGDNMMEEGM